MPRKKNKPPHDPKRSLLYVGPVTVAVGDLHEQALQGAAVSRGLHVVDVHRESTTRSLAERQHFLALLIQAEREGVGTVLTVGVSALAEDAAQEALARRLVERAGATWVPLSPERAWSHDEVERVLAVLKQHESMIFRPKVILGQQGGPEARPGGPPPWGYRRDEVTGQFVPVRAEQEALQELLRMRGEGAGLGTMAAYLEGLQLSGRSGRIHKSTVKSILHRLDRRGGRP